MTKRLLDLVVAVLLLMALLPVLLSLWLLTRLMLGPPVFFAQIRPGLLGRPFRIWKFRTMSEERDGDSRLLPDAQRMTPFGAWLRRTSLDELPELLNVIKGDMSLVGPRPLLMEYLPLYSAEQARRHEVRPGITGWAQVNGRNAISWTEMLEFDVWYVDHCSFWLDIKILWLTVIKVFRAEGISQTGHATVGKFGGSKT